MNGPQQQFMSIFTETLIKIMNPDKTLVVGVPLQDRPDSRDFPTIFQPKESHEVRTFFDTELGNGDEFDLILGSIPMGLRPNSVQKSRMSSKYLNWDLFFTFSKHLKPDGFGLFLIEPYGFTKTGQNRHREFLQLMEKESVYVEGYINLPPKILEPCTTLQPLLVVLSRKKHHFKLLDLSQESGLEDRTQKFFKSNIGDENTSDVDVSSFRGFRVLEVARQINTLETRYKEYHSVPLQSLCQKTVRGNRDRDFEDTGNCIYFKLLGSNNNLHTRKDQLTGRTDNYLQLQLTDQIDNEYLRIFFKSSLGQLILDYVINSQMIPRVDPEMLMSSDIPVPDLSVQLQLVETDRRFEILQSEIEVMKRQISLNPQSSSTSSKIDEMLKISNSLSDGDRIKSLILQGESKFLEFKQTFQYCLRSKQKQDYVEVSSLKTIVGFLNSEGGSLLIGIEDSGLIIGVGLGREKFHKTSSDRFLLHLKDKLKSRIGQGFMGFIDMTIIEVDENPVIRVDCGRSDEEVFLDEKDFYIRTSPSTDKLEGRDLSQYVLRRFNQD